MAISHVKFDENLSILLENQELKLTRPESKELSADSKSEEWHKYANHLQLLYQYLDQENKQLREEFQKISMEPNEETDLMFQARGQTWICHINKFFEFLESNLGKSIAVNRHTIDSYSFYKWLLQKHLVLLEKLQTLIKTELHFKETWSQTALLIRQNTIHAILFHGQEISIDYIPEALQLIPNWIKLLSQYDVNDLCRQSLLRLYFEAYTTASPKKGAELIDFIFHVAKNCQSREPERALSEIICYGLTTPVDMPNETRHDLLWERLRFIYQADQESHQVLPARKSIFNNYILPLTSAHLLTFKSHPLLFLRLLKYNLFNLNYEYLAAVETTRLLDLCEIIAPDYILELFQPIFNGKIKLNTLVLAKLIEMLEWIAEKITKDSSSINREKMCDITHRIFALLWDNLNLAEHLFKISSHQFDAFFQLLLTKNSFEKAQLSDFVSLFSEEKNHPITNLVANRLIKVIHQNPLIEKPLHFWLNMVIKLHDDNFDKSESILLPETLKKLPINYTGLILKMLEITQSEPECIEQFFSLAFAFPYINTLTKYLEQLKKIPLNSMLKTMQQFNDLVSEYPDLLPQTINHLNNIASFIKLQMIDPELYVLIMTVYKQDQNASQNTDDIIELTDNESLRQKIKKLATIGQQFGISLIPIFLSNKKLLNQCSEALLKLLMQEVLFAKQFSIFFMHNFREPMLHLQFITEKLEKHQKELLELFAITVNVPNVLQRIFVTLMRYDFSNSFYQKIMAFNKTHPHLISRLLWVMEHNSEVGDVILNANTLKPIELENVLELCLEHRYVAAKELLANLEKNITSSVSSLTIATQVEAKKEKPTNFFSPDELETSLLHFMNEQDRKDLQTTTLTPYQRTKFTLGIAKTLITDQGVLNTDLIDEIQKTATYTALKNSLFLKNYLDRTLNIIKTYPEFKNLLETLSEPIPFTHAELIIKKMVGSPEKVLTAKDARIVALGALLTPVRQCKVDSCFVTSQIIKAASEPTGLLQLFKDYLTLLSENRIYRGEPTSNYFLVYPIAFNFDEFASEFSQDNLLARAGEYLIANMSQNSNLRNSDHRTLKEDISWRWSWESFVVDNFQLPSYKLPVNVINDTTKNIFNEMSNLIYTGHTFHEFEKRYGAWVLIDSETLQPLHKAKSTRINFFNKIIEKSTTILGKQYPEHKEEITSLFKKNLFNLKLFERQFFRYESVSDAVGVSRLNPVKYQHFGKVTPYLSFTGESREVIETTFYGKPTYLYAPLLGYSPFETLITLYSELGFSKLKINHQVLLVSVRSNNHTFNLDITKIEEIKAKGSSAIQKELLAQADMLAKTPLTEENVTAMIERYFFWQKYPNSETSQLHRKLLMHNMQDYTCLDDLCREIIKSDRELMGEKRDNVGRILDWAIRSMPEFQDKLPSIYPFADTNWEDAEVLGLSCYLHDRSFQYVLTNYAGQFRALHWSPGAISSWSVYICDNDPPAPTRLKP